MKKANIIIIAIILLSFAVGVYFYPLMPDKMASHWNAKGEVDGYMGKSWGLFLMPAISLIMYLMFLLIPKLDPLKENIIKFRKYFDLFIIAIISFLFYIYILTIAWNWGLEFNLARSMAPAFAVLFYICGILVENTKPNWFIGIRTPWTLSNEKVWEKTNKLGAKMFKASAVISLLGFVFPNLAVWFVLVPVIFFSIYLIIYSYYEFKRRNL